MSKTQNTQTSPSSDDAPLAPAEMLELMRTQQRSARKQLDRGVIAILWAWAISWCIGFFALWSAENTGGNPWFRFPETPSFIVFGVLIAAAIAVSIVAGIRMGNGMRGGSNLTGTLYGLSWSIGMTGAWLFASALFKNGMPEELGAILMPGIFIFTCGVLYLGGAAIFRSMGMFTIGVIMIVVVIVASFFGGPSNYLIYATVAPAVFAVYAILMTTGVIKSQGESSADLVGVE